MIWDILGVISLFVVAFMGIVVDFALRSRVIDHTDQLPSTAVVFTGQFDRIERGLELLAAGEVKHLFISGVNPKAGLTVRGFADQFSLTSDQRVWLETDKITLAPDAHSTLENALETACWLDHHPDVLAVALITSQQHMARASVALERAIGPVRIIRVASDPVDAHLTPWNNLREARKFVATWALTLLPRRFWPADMPSNCPQN